MKVLLLVITLFFSYTIKAETIHSNDFMSKLIKLDTTKESHHLIITKLTENHNIRFFTHDNIMYVLDGQKLNSINKNKVIRLITLMDKLLSKRKQFYEMAKSFSTYHILYLNEMKDYDVSTNKSIGEVFEMIQNIDKSLINAITEIQEIYKQEQ